MKKGILLGAVCVLLSLPLSAQTADYVTEMLGTAAATYAQVSYISAVCQGLVGDSAAEQDAFNALSADGQLPAGAEADATVTLETLSYMMAKIWGVRGGFMCRLTNGSPRYVFRQFKADGILPADADPSESVPGSGVLDMYTVCRSVYGSEK